MRNLADAVLDYYLYLYFAGQGTLDAERSVLLVELYNQIEYVFTVEEKLALREAAVRRLAAQQKLLESGYPPRYPMGSAEDLFLGNIAGGYFDIPALDDLVDPEEQVLREE